jgi:hypothetical protein
MVAGLFGLVLFGATRIFCLQLTFYMTLCYFIQFLAGIILAIFIWIFPWPQELFAIICVVGLIALHVFFSLKVIKAHIEAAKNRNSTDKGLYSRTQKRLIRAILYFITFWGCVLLIIVILKYWVVPLTPPSRMSLMDALNTFLDIIDLIEKSLP